MSEENKNQFDKIKDIQLEKQMKDAYIDYSMSVIVGRALPDVRDGLKPVHRRILYTMHRLGLTPEKAYRKSAHVVGNVMADFHPHSNIAIYDAMVKMAQPFSMRYPLVDGQGNFGTLDGDSAAAERYTEARMDRLALEMLRDIEKETVDFGPNYDESQKEPLVLPAKYPNLLVNGSNGIAVGMATSIPPHNLGEVIDGVIELIDNPEASVEDLMRHIKGPDFPTGATIMGKSSIREAYRTGRGKVVVRAKAEIEELPNGKSQIIFTEIPYQINKARMVEKIAELVKEKRIDGITDLRDESNRKGIRIVVEARRDVSPAILLNNLYKHSQLQDIYSVIMLTLVGGQPKILDLREMLVHYLGHQKEVLTRKTVFELKKAKDRAHILEGLLIAIDHIDEVIHLIRSAYSDALEKLMERFSLSEVQAQSILDMRLRRLQGLEREKIQEEYKEILENIQYLQSILDDESVLLGIIKEELTKIKEKHGNERRTEILEAAEEINVLDTIEDEEVAVTMTHHGYIKRLPMDTYKNQRRGGKGITSMTTRDEDFVTDLLLTTNHAKILFLTSRGRLFRLNVYEIPQSGRAAKGVNIVNLLQLEKDEKISSLLPIRDVADDAFLVMCTKKGVIKKTPISEFRKSTRNGLIAISLKEDDQLITVKITDGKQQFIVVTKEGKAIVFDESQVRDMGRSAMGVRAMRLSAEDEVVSMELVDLSKDVLVISEKGYGKRTPLEEYKPQARGGMGVKTYKISEKTGKVVGARVVSEREEVMIVNSDGSLIRMDVSQISRLSRVTSGVKVMKTEEGSLVASLARIASEEEKEQAKEGGND
ncbi:MAG: DNA gyrase subunit A [Peptostreptococcaceae bacterium]|nr:DNA gyrase subunit A [Peptostreptococcaceae bacterium]